MMHQSRWMEQPLAIEQKRLAALNRQELAIEVGRLSELASEDDVLYLLYTIQEAYLAMEDGTESYSAVVEPYLRLDGVEQVMAIFMYERGERYSFDLALRTSSPYLPYGLSLKLEEVAQFRKKTLRAKQQTDDSAYLQLEGKPSGDLTEEEWIELYRHGTIVEQMRGVGQTSLVNHPSLAKYIASDYLTGRDVQHQSVLVSHLLLGQIPRDERLYPLYVENEAFDIWMAFDHAEQLEVYMKTQTDQLQRFADAAFALERMDPFKAILFMNWYQILFPDERIDRSEPLDDWLDAIEELAELDFVSKMPPGGLGQQAQKIYRAVHLLLPEGTMYEQALLQ